MPRETGAIRTKLAKLTKDLKEAQQVINSLTKLLKTTRLVVSATNIDNLLDVIMRMAEEIMNAQASSLTLLDEKTGDLKFVVARGEARRTIKDKRIKPGQGITGWVAKTGEYLISNDPYNDPRFDPSFDKESGFKTRSYLCMPMKTFEGRVIGTVQVLNKREGEFTKKDAEIFEHFCNLSAIAIRNQQLFTFRDERKQIEADLDYAHSIQQSFLPKSFPQLKDYDFNTLYIPARQVGGDFYDILPIKNNRIAVYIADVSGKGIPAALFMSKMSSDLRFLLEKGENAEEVIREINKSVSERSSRGMFVTLLLIIISIKTGSVQVLNAGHISLFILGEKGTIIFQISENPPLGVRDKLEFKTQQFTIKPGERIVLITDGVTDISDKEGNYLGIEGVRNLLEKYRNSPDFLGDFLKQINEYTRQFPQADDISVVTVYRSPLPDYPFIKREMVTFSDTDHTAEIKGMVEDVAAQMGFNRKNINLLTVAVLEAFSNIVKYAYGGEVGKIRLRVIGEGKAIKIFLRDYGKKVEEEKIVSRDLKDVRPGGLGVHFMREIMDSVEYLPVEDGNELRLIKRTSVK